MNIKKTSLEDNANISTKTYQTNLSIIEQVVSSSYLVMGHYNQKYTCLNTHTRTHTYCFCQTVYS